MFSGMVSFNFTNVTWLWGAAAVAAAATTTAAAGPWRHVMVVVVHTRVWRMLVVAVVVVIPRRRLIAVARPGRGPLRLWRGAAWRGVRGGRSGAGPSAGKGYGGCGGGRGGLAVGGGAAAHAGGRGFRCGGGGGGTAAAASTRRAAARRAHKALTVRVEVADLHVALPVLEAHEELVTDREEAASQPSPHLVGAEGAELRAGAVQVEPF